MQHVGTRKSRLRHLFLNLIHRSQGFDRSGRTKPFHAQLMRFQDHAASVNQRQHEHRSDALGELLALGDRRAEHARAEVLHPRRNRLGVVGPQNGQCQRPVLRVQE